MRLPPVFSQTAQEEDVMMIRYGTAADRERILRIRPQAAALLSDGEGSYLLIAEEDGELLGCAAVFRREIPAPVAKEEAFINLIDVFEEANRRKGVGSSLVREILAVERGRGTYQARAYCEIGHVASHRLWMSCGFGIAPVKIGESIVGSYVTCVLDGTR